MKKQRRGGKKKSDLESVTLQKNPANSIVESEREDSIEARMEMAERERERRRIGRESNKPIGNAVCVCCSVKYENISLRNRCWFGSFGACSCLLVRSKLPVC